MLGATGVTPTVVEDEKAVAAVAYILTWLTGLIILLIAKQDQQYARWNAIQAIGLGIAAFVFALAGAVVASAFAFTAGAAAMAMVSVINLIVWLTIVAVAIVLAVMAYQGKPVRLPVIAGFADKYA